ncbi:membrane protein insertion efficiency factor YidD [bacterium]|nr:membrane protein insertion efficiency factor YidD [bacterium]
MYKRLVSPFLPPACRFTPTCSEYAAECFRTLPFFRALGLSLRRLTRCRPGGGHGADFPPTA